MAAPKRRTGRPPLTDRATLLVAAFEIGFPDLTVGKVTTAVGVKYSTFYRHFPSLADLVSAMCEEALSGLMPPDGDRSWDRYLHEITVGLHNVLVTYPGMAEAIAASHTWPDWLVQAAPRAEAVLKSQGFTEKEAGLVVLVVVNMILRMPAELRVRAVTGYLEGVASG